MNNSSPDPYGIDLILSLLKSAWYSFDSWAMQDPGSAQVAGKKDGSDNTKQSTGGILKINCNDSLRKAEQRAIDLRKVKRTE
jgi:hypothetical protein